MCIPDPIELMEVSGISCLTNSSVSAANYAYLAVPGDIRSSYVFTAKSGMITLGSGRFPEGTQNITLRYTACYATTPASLEQICIDLSLSWYYGRKRDKALKSERIGDYAYAVQDQIGGIPPEIKDRLSPFKSRPL